MPFTFRGHSGHGSRYEFAGEVRARTELRLGFRVAGKILHRPAEIGQRVKRGDLLAQLDRVSALPLEYPGWMLGFQGRDRAEQAAASKD